jgi:hypothetical protein
LAIGYLEKGETTTAKYYVAFIDKTEAGTGLQMLWQGFERNLVFPFKTMPVSKDGHCIPEIG